MDLAPINVHRPGNANRAGARNNFADIIPLTWVISISTRSARRERGTGFD